MPNPLFYAKILLFGEYGIIENSQGLTLPYSFYKGCFKFSALESEFEKKSNESLKKYWEYLAKLELPEQFRLDLPALKKDIENGLFFDSNIPQGYGVGSSGALVAAIFDRYSVVQYKPEEIGKNELKELKKVFGELESFFHGKSSGIDPLICYMNLPILIENKENVGRVEIPEENEGFRKTLKEEFIKYNNACIQSFLNKEMTPFFKNMKALSKWAYEHFRPMIPDSVFNAWKKGLDTNAYYLKLCGSGGGGYILGFTKDYQKAEKMLKGFHKEVIYRF